MAQLLARHTGSTVEKTPLLQGQTLVIRWRDRWGRRYKRRHRILAFIQRLLLLPSTVAVFIESVNVTVRFLFYFIFYSVYPSVMSKTSFSLSKKPFFFPVAELFADLKNALASS